MTLRRLTKPRTVMTDMSKFYKVLAAASELSKSEQNRLISELKNLQRNEVVDQLNIGTIVKINHKKINPMDQFRITKINRKNVKCQKLNSNAIYTVTPSLLEVIS